MNNEKEYTGETKFKFERLRVWQESMDFAEEMHALANGFPDNEKFNLSSQLRRAADSISLNIAEGSIFQSNKEQNKFIGYAIRSLAETITCLHKAKRRNYIEEDIFNQHYKTAYKLMNMLLAFSNSLKNTDKKRSPITDHSSQQHTHRSSVTGHRSKTTNLQSKNNQK